MARRRVITSYSIHYTKLYDATYGLVSQPKFLLDLTAKYKFGTASVSKGLGTGENDFGLVLDAYFPMGKATPFITTGYRLLGDPPGQNLHNTRQLGGGIAYKVSDQTSLGIIYDWRSAASSAGRNNFV